MALSPASGALSQTQLQALEQIRAMRAARPAAPAPATAAAVEAKPATGIEPKTTPAQPLAMAAAANPTATNRPRGSILNITV